MQRSLSTRMRGQVDLVCRVGSSARDRGRFRFTSGCLETVRLLLGTLSMNRSAAGRVQAQPGRAFASLAEAGRIQFDAGNVGELGDLKQALL